LEFDFCQNCGNSIKEEPSEKQGIAPKKTVQAKVSPIDKFKGLYNGNKPLAIGILAAPLVLIALIIIIIAIASGDGSRGAFSFGRRSNIAKPYILYVKDNEIHFTYMDTLEPFELTNRLIESDNNSRATDYEYHDYVVMSADGRYIFYPDRIGRQNLSTYFYLDLSLSPDDDARVPVRIDTDVILGTAELSEDGNTLFYIKGSDRRLFYYDIREGRAERVDSGVTTYFINNAGTYIVYGKDDDTIREINLTTGEASRIDSESFLFRVGDDAGVVYYRKDDSLFARERGGERRRLLSDVPSVLSFVSESSIYFLRYDTVSLRLMDFVEDDMRDSPNVWIRDQLMDENLEMEILNLYYFNGDRSVMVAENISDLFTVAQTNAIAVYTRHEPSNINRRNLSVINSVREVENMARNSMRGSLSLYIAYMDRETELMADRAGGFAFNNSGTALYYLDDYSTDRDHGILTTVMFDDQGAVSRPIVVANDVHSYRFGNQSDMVFYFVDVKDGVGDVYYDGRSIATDVLLRSLYSYPNSPTIAYFIDYSDRNQNGTLIIRRDGVTTKIADEVYSFVAYDNNNIAYLVDYRTARQRGDAYLFDGSDERKRIDIDVAALLWNPMNADRFRIVRYHSTHSFVNVQLMAGNIIGRWINEPEWGTPWGYSFFADGTMEYVQYNDRGAVDWTESSTYYIEGDRLHMPQWSWITTFSITGDVLSFIDDWGNVVSEYVRAGH
jgi:hypothetical protein